MNKESKLLHHTDITYIEKVSDKFELPDYLEARAITMEIVDDVANSVRVGMCEKEIHELVEASMAKRAITKKWHPTKCRIGTNTLKSFREKSDQELILQENDLYFIDIGPVINNYEGDFGRTFTVGENEDNRLIKLAVENIFEKTRDFYLQKKISGSKLYEFAINQAKEMGYELNLNTAGHRLGDFPHALYYKGKLLNIESAKIAHPYLWVLEIQIKHPHKKIGAFYEDILSCE